VCTATALTRHLEAVVHALRKKLGAHASMIETVRGVGYRLR
jgi:DNA-binding response OmpR family regulator